MSFAQSTVLVVDATLTTNITNTGSPANTQGVGFTRGSGTLAGPQTGDSYTWGGLGATSEAAAIANDEYLSWSLSADAGYSINATEVSIALARNGANGPTAFRIFYSLDNFATAGIPVSSSSTSSLGYNSNFNNMIKTFNGFNVITADAGTITFRMYAWGGSSENASAYLRIFPISSWDAFGINTTNGSGPGVRVLGAVSDPLDDVLITAESNIIASSYNPSAITDYLTKTATSGLTQANSIKIGEFTIQDGGDDLTDDDDLNTNLSNISFNVSNFSNLAALAIFDGSTNVSEVTSVNATTSFSAINGGAGLTALDNGSKTFSVYATFQSTVTDNQKIALTVNTASTGTNSSQFTNANAGGASTPLVADDNQILVTATVLAFNNQPTSVSVNTVMSPSPTVRAQDSNGNIDLDFNSDITLLPSTAGIFAGAATKTVTAVSGQAIFNNLIFQTGGSGYTLSASGGSLANSSQSSSFNVIAPTGAGWQISQINTEYRVNFDNTVDGVNNGAYAGAGNVTSPSLGQLDSNSWSLSTTTATGASTFNQSNTNAVFTRGISQGDTDLGGFHAFDIDNNDNAGAQNYAFGIQPNNTVFTPGNATLRARNVTGSEVTSVLLQYTVYVNNDKNASNTLRFAYSTSNAGSYTPLTNQAVVSPSTADTEGWVAYDRTIIITGLNIPNDDNGFFYMRWRITDGDSASYDEFAIDDIKVTFNTSVNILYTYDGTNWSPNSPEGSDANGNLIQINTGDIVFSDSSTMADVVNIRPGASLTLSNDAILNVSDELILDSNSQNYSSLDIRNGSIEGTGTLKYNRHVNDLAPQGSTTGGNDLISAPLTSLSQTFGSFRTTDGNNIPSGTIGTDPTTYYLFGPYNNTGTPGYINWTSANDNQVLTPGVGYRSASSSTTSDLFTFTGNVATGDVSVSILNSTSSYNLIGNPYPSFIDPAVFLSLQSNQNIMDEEGIGIYGYDGSAQDGWTVINLANMNSANNIAPGQGFLIFAESNGTILFTPDMITVASNDDFILGRNAVDSHLKLNVTSNSKTYHTDFYFNDNSSLGLDPGYDAALMTIGLPNFYLYSHLVEENNGRSMMIQSLSNEDLNDAIIPLGLKASQGQQVTFSIGESTLDENIDIYLEDNLTNTFTLLNTGDYTFTANSAINGTGRFFLRTSNEALSTIDNTVNSIEVFTNNRSLFVNGQLLEDSNVTIYDIQGRTVFKTQLNGGSSNNQIDVSNLSTGIYVVKLNNSKQDKTQKVIIK